MTNERLIEYLLGALTSKYPFPWRIERDWTYEILDAHGKMVAQTYQLEEAEEIIERATRHHEKVKAGVEAALNKLEVSECVSRIV